MQKFRARFQDGTHRILEAEDIYDAFRVLGWHDLMRLEYGAQNMEVLLVRSCA